MRAHGFTLIEMLVVITISAILIAAAVPSFQWLIARNRIADATNLIVATLQYARLEASRRGQRVSVCRVLDAAVDPPVCSSVAGGGFDGNDWASGWVMFAKADANMDLANFEVNDLVLRRHQALVTGSNIRVNAHSGVPGAQRIAFPPHATGGTAGAGTFAIDYRVPDTPAINDRALGTITVSNAGRCLVVAPLIGTMRIAAPVASAC